MELKEKEVEKILKALANRRRLAIIKYLHNHKDGFASVGNIADAIKLSFKATSKHLGILRAADILDREQTSLTMLYRLTKPLNTILKTTLTHL